MSVIHNLRRYHLIVLKIKNNPYISFKELESHIEKQFSDEKLHEVGVSRRTLQRDIENIRTEFGIEIKYDKRRNGYYIEDTGFKSVLDDFLDSFQVLNSLNGERDIAGFVLPERHSPKGANHLSPLIQAIKNTRQIAFSYQKFGEAKESIREVEPYVIKEFKGRWYLLARTVGKHDMKTYGLDRIKELEISDVPFQKDVTVDFTEYFQSSFGIYTTENFPVEEVILSFDKYDGSYLKSLPLHHSQEVLCDTDDEFRIKLRLRITPDFIMEMLSRSTSLKVIQPDLLRERVCAICHSAVERNQK
jgi:predicted DNA-binding transcriptional regulator YafY